MNEYAAWIADYAVRHNGDVRFRCRSATEEMVAAFPTTLRRARGWVHLESHREQHWWCVDGKENIVDPTATQFASKILRYEEFDPAIHEEPKGKCAYCGEYCWTDAPTTWACSDECAQSLAESV